MEVPLKPRSARPRRFSQGPHGSKLATVTANGVVTKATSSARADSRWSEANSYGAKKKHQAWCRLPNGDWALGTIQSTSGTESTISLPEGIVLKLSTESLVPANPDILDGVDDLMQLSYLNEPSVLYNLQHRYSNNLLKQDRCWLPSTHLRKFIYMEMITLRHIDAKL